MTLFEMEQEGNENRVYIKNSSNHFGTTMIGEDCAVFSGCGRLSVDDYSALTDIADEAGDDSVVNFNVQITVGPKWREIFQCSPLIASRLYLNTDADEDDQQLWEISPCTWEIVEAAGGKRIRLKFSMSQRGEHTHFHGISYQATATGSLMK
jgi:hypothetical protein